MLARPKACSHTPLPFQHVGHAGYVGMCLRSNLQDYFEWKGEGVPRCSCGGFTRPDIVLFGESLPPEFHQKSKTDFQEADLLIIMGTSLQAGPGKSIFD